MAKKTVLKRIYDAFFGFTIMEGGTAEEVFDFLDGLPEPKDDLDRSVLQYRGEMYYVSTGRRVAGNVACLLAFLPLMVWIVASTLFRPMQGERSDMALVYFAAPHISSLLIPSEELEGTDPASVVRVTTSFDPLKLRLDRRGWSLLLKSAVRARFEPFFVAKALVKLSQAGHIVYAYAPVKVVTNTESSFSTSVLTSYFEGQGIDYIGIMHGEFFANSKASFFRFTRFYAWDDYYKGLLLRQRCEENQIRISTPPSLNVPGYVPSTKPTYDITYYCQLEDDETKARLASALGALQAEGMRCRVRLHPLSLRGDYEDIFPSGVELEPEGLSLGESLSVTSRVAGRCSTVLYQSFRLGIPVIIDDYSDRGEYSSLQLKGYRMLDAPHELMSNLLKERDSID